MFGNSVLVIGYGSIGRKHARVLKKKLKVENVVIYTKRKIKEYKTISNQNDIKKLNPFYIIIASPTSEHFKYLKFVEKNFKKKKVLIEKPIFNKFRKFNIKNNYVFVGYNLRFHPVLQKLKKMVNNKDVLNISLICNSYLPDWRLGVDYKKNYSANKKLGGGVLLDLSHEIDYLLWLIKHFKITYIYNKKISKLKINSDDIGIINGRLGNGGHIQINLSYFSRHSVRQIFLDTNKYSFFGDLNKNFYSYKNSSYNRYKYFKNNDQNKMIYEMHKAILNNKSKYLCSFNEGLNVLKVIKKMKSLSQRGHH